jgi:flavodoxin I
MASVLYYSMTGSTKKMASAIAEELGVRALSLKETAELPQDGVLFMGSGCYGDKPGEDMAKFIAAHDFAGRKVALFGTSGAGAGKEVTAMEGSLKNKGATVLGSYHSKGRAFVVVNIGHPNKDDLEGARKFAREMAKLG